MTENEKQQLSAAKYLVGFAVFALVFWVWDTLGVSVFAIQVASPNLSSDEFQTRSFGLSLMGPVLAAVGFVFTSVGQLVIALVVRLVARLTAEPVAASVDGKTFADRAKTEAALNQLASRLKKAEASLKAWESSES